MWKKPQVLVLRLSQTSRPAMAMAKRDEGIRRPVSRVLSPPCGGRWPFLWDARRRAPRATDPGGSAETRLPVARHATPIWSCSRWGLPCRFRCRSRGGLLPHRFTLAVPVNRAGGLFSVALSLGSPPPAVSRHRVSWSPDFPHPRPFDPCGCGRPANWQSV